MLIQHIFPGHALRVNYPGHNKHDQIGRVACVRISSLGVPNKQVGVYFRDETFERLFSPEHLSTPFPRADRNKSDLWPNAHLLDSVSLAMDENGLVELPVSMEPDQPEQAKLHVSKMSDDDLAHLSVMFIEEPESFANFHSLWQWFLGQTPTIEEVYRFLEEVEELGYFIEEAIEHPYAKEWGGSHSGVTENGTPYHMTCSKEFAQSPAINELHRAIDRAANDDETDETDEQLEARTDRNMNLISSFLDHVKAESGIEIPEEVLLSFFEA